MGSSGKLKAAEDEEPNNDDSSSSDSSKDLGQPFLGFPGTESSGDTHLSHLLQGLARH